MLDVRDDPKFRVSPEMVNQTTVRVLYLIRVKYGMGRCTTLENRFSPQRPDQTTVRVLYLFQVKIGAGRCKVSKTDSILKEFTKPPFGY